MESFTIIESFTDLEDAFQFLDHDRRSMATEGWEVQQTSGINYVNHQWRVGINYERQRKKKDEQLILPEITDGY